MLIINNDNFISCPCNPQKATRRNHLEAWSWSLDLHPIKYGKLLKMGDFEARINESHAAILWGI